MQLVEGTWYCPAMPQDLVDITTQFRQGLIDEDTYRDKLGARHRFAMRRQGADDTGDTQAFMCPGRGKGKTEDRWFKLLWFITVPTSTDPVSYTHLTLPTKA